MNWIAYVLFAAALVLLFILRRAEQISVPAAREHLKNGAVIIDVRTPGEFASGHLPKAINLPLDQIATTLPRRVPQKNAVLLLHCQSGMRSGTARRKLRALGYTQVFNLGSLSRAGQIVAGE